MKELELEADARDFSNFETLFFDEDNVRKLAPLQLLLAEKCEKAIKAWPRRRRPQHVRRSVAAFRPQQIARIQGFQRQHPSHPSGRGRRRPTTHTKRQLGSL